MSDIANMDYLSKQSFQILRAFTMSVYENYQEIKNIKPDDGIIDWVRKTQKIINEYTKELLKFPDERIIEGINTQAFIKIQNEIILERLKTIPRRELQISNLLYQKLIEVFSLHNQYLFNEWLLA